MAIFNENSLPDLVTGLLIASITGLFALIIKYRIHIFNMVKKTLKLSLEKVLLFLGTIVLPIYAFTTVTIEFYGKPVEFKLVFMYFLILLIVVSRLVIELLLNDIKAGALSAKHLELLEEMNKKHIEELNKIAERMEEGLNQIQDKHK